jgi:arylformamidase
VPEWASHMARWQALSAQARTALKPSADIPYSAGDRCRFDLFEAAPRRVAMPLVVYIHGGYWMRGDRRDYSFVAAPFVANGCDVAIPSYTLCPDTTIAGIVVEMQAFIRVLWARTGRRPLVVGHSAGGHLAAALLATDWSAGGEGNVPRDLVRAAYSVSGVFDLTPLPSTTHNETLRLTAATSRASSPRFGPLPAAGRRFVAAVGGSESREFIRQSVDLAGHWSAAGIAAECVLIPGANHFTVVDEVVRTGGATFERILDMAR